MQTIGDVFVILYTRRLCRFNGIAGRAKQGCAQLLCRCFCHFGVARCAACFVRRMCRLALPMPTLYREQPRRPCRRSATALRRYCTRHGKICGTGTMQARPRQSWHFTAEPLPPCQKVSLRPVWKWPARLWNRVGSARSVVPHGLTGWTLQHFCDCAVRAAAWWSWAYKALMIVPLQLRAVATRAQRRLRPVRRCVLLA